MPLTATLLNTHKGPGGDNPSRLFSGAITGTYPNGGYAVDMSAHFSAIKRVRWERYGNMDVNGHLYTASVSGTTATIKAYEFATGGLGPVEIPLGQAHAETIYFEVEGIPLSGVDSEPW